MLFRTFLKIIYKTVKIQFSPFYLFCYTAALKKRFLFCYFHLKKYVNFLQNVVD